MSVDALHLENKPAAGIARISGRLSNAHQIPGRLRHSFMLSIIIITDLRFWFIRYIS